MLLPATDAPKPNSSLKCCFETRNPGRQSLVRHRTTTAARPATSFWATRLQTPKPAKAMAIAATPPIALATVERSARLLKASRRWRIAIWVLLRAPNRKPRDSRRRTPVRRGSRKKTARGADASRPHVIRMRPLVTLTQKAVSRCSALSSARCTMAAAKPWSSRISTMAVKTAASATRPKASGESSRVRTSRMTNEIPSRPHFWMTDQTIPLAARCFRFVGRSVSASSFTNSPVLELGPHQCLHLGQDLVPGLACVDDVGGRRAPVEPPDLRRALAHRHRILVASPNHARHGDLRIDPRSEEHTSELQSLTHLVCRLMLEKKKR